MMTIARTATQHSKAFKAQGRPARPPPTLAASLRRMQSLVERRVTQRIVASWDLGRLGGQVLQPAHGDPPRLSVGELGVRIGLWKVSHSGAKPKPVDDSTLRQMIKFARLATRAQAQELQRAAVSWRGVVYWLWVENAKQRAALYARMVGGLHDGQQIRRHIQDRFGKRARPRIPRDPAKALAKAQDAAAALVAVLNELDTTLSLRQKPAPAAARQQFARVLRTASRRIGVALRGVGRTGS